MTPREPIQPTVPGRVEGIISMDPLRVQCQQCGTTSDAQSMGLSADPKWANHVLLFSGIEFCSASPLRRCEECRSAAADCPRCDKLS